MDQADDQEKQYRANRGLNDCRDDARTEMDPELRKDPACDEGACYSHDEIADGAKACTPTIWPASQPAAMPTINMMRRLSPDRVILRPHTGTAQPQRHHMAPS